ncbi:glycosyltransferase family 39 protein [Actinophytocola sp.]|uniref:glycosyltransferase family 39 protein n=1 Tax=Actinophytocola sp. TaxID=1872138 RepID=UPI002ED18D58
MTVVATTDADAAPAPTRTDRPQWARWALAAICVVAAGLYAWQIGSGQLGNTYYSAAAKSMTGSFTNFLFGSFDPYGVVTVDKPPMSLWPQALSVTIFGFHGWSVLLPQVIEGVAAVFLLHRTVRLWAGENAALLAALILTLTPITVAINRTNNTDTLLMLLLVAAAYAFTRSVKAAESRVRTRWLLLCAFLIGCGFLTKMMQAWIVVPGIAVAYFVGTSAPVKRRVLDLLGAGGVLFVSSFWWVALHAWWPGDKPYIGGSTDGSAWDLIFGYNGFGRVFGGDGNPAMGGGGLPGGMQMPAGMSGMGGGAFTGGSPGISRMFDTSVGGQISWLMPLALLVLAVVAVAGTGRMRATLPGNPAERAGWFLWGGWLLVTTLVFSYAEGIWHPYYTTMLAPAIAAIAAAGLVRFWHSYRESTIGWWLLPLAVALTAAWAFVLAARDTSWHGWTRWAVLTVAVVAVGGLVAGRLTSGQLGRPALVVGLVAVLLVPAVWSTAAATTDQSGTIPAAGPAGGMPTGSLPGGMTLPGMPPGTNPFPGMPGNAQPSPGAGQTQPPGGMMSMFGGTGLTADQRNILRYAEQNRDGAAITLAVNAPAMMAASYIMGSDTTVIGMGGFGGTDNAPSVNQLENWTANGTLRFVLSSSGMGFVGRLTGQGGGDHTRQRHEWVEQHCEKVDPTAYGGSSAPTEQGAGFMGMGAQTLYDCRS